MIIFYEKSDTDFVKNTSKNYVRGPESRATVDPNDTQMIYTVYERNIPTDGID